MLLRTRVIDRWMIQKTNDDVYVNIVDDQGCPVAQRVYFQDAEWIIAQRDQAAQQQRQQDTEGRP